MACYQCTGMLLFHDIKGSIHSRAGQCSSEVHTRTQYSYAESLQNKAKYSITLSGKEYQNPVISNYILFLHSKDQLWPLNNISQTRKFGSDIYSYRTSTAYMKTFKANKIRGICQADRSFSSHEYRK